MRTLIALAALASIGLSAHAAGTVTVSFVDPDKYSDAANSQFERPATLKTLEAHLQYLGKRYLADGQTLSIEVLDVDLAGEMRPSRRTGTEIRIARGGADWPRMNVRYVLEGGGLPSQRGEERIADMDYQHHIPNYSSREPLRHEKQMLDAWFKAKFAPPQ
jgi:hypothetical protein